MEQETLVIIFWSLNMGGIETNAVQIMKNALDKKRRTIWVGDSKKEYSSNFRDVIESPNLEFVSMNIHSIDLFKIPAINFRTNEKITFVTFNLYDCFKAFKFRSKYRENQIKVICVVPHFTSPAVLLEQTLYKPFQGLVKSTCGNIYKELYDNGNLHFFSDIHHEALENNYHISLPGSTEKVVRNLRKQIGFSVEKRQAIYRNKTKFTIVSAGRFEFPHKGFLVGLIKEFARLSIKYPQLELLIIGEGAGKDTLDRLINSLPESIQDKITFKTPVPPARLVEIMLECDLNISVAGCASIGAKAGVLTLPARHYTYDCEVYGFIPECAGKFTSSEPGYPASDFIEKAVNMTEEEYIAACEKNYSWFNQYEPNLNYPFDTVQHISYYPSKKYFVFLRIVFLIYRFSFLVKRIFG